MYGIMLGHQSQLERPHWPKMGQHEHQIHGAQRLLYIYTYAAKSLQLCLPLCNPIDGSPLGSPVPGILQARTLEWVAISFSNA